MKKFKIKYVVYPFELMVFITNDTKKVVNWVCENTYRDRKEVEENVEREYLATTIMFEGGQSIIVFKEDSHLNPGVVAHESFHAVELLYNHLDMPLTRESSEAYAYLIEYIVNEISNKVYDKKRIPQTETPKD